MKKSDIARAWKDESYRQTLSEEELNCLPANPAGELSEAEMETVNGGDVWPGFGGSGAAASSSSASDFQKRHIGSFSVLCPIDVFSVRKIDVGLLAALTDLLKIAECKRQVCIRDDD